MKILIIEDDHDLSLAISEYLELHNIDCDFAYNGETGIQLASQQTFDCVILDNMLPNVQGMAVCRELREQGIDTPVLMLTACGADTDQLEGFRAGVDDYVVKPCTMPLLLARLQALHRRHQPVRECITIADLTIYPKEHIASRGDTPLKLTPIGWNILLLLARRSPTVVSKSDIEEAIWASDDVRQGTINVHLHHLRKVVDKPFAKTLIHTHVGIGLSLSEAAPV
ncbi:MULTISPECIES: response regulator transcription factor [unclassified Salinivibrio]|uniref:response regulator transcription factor n=1 Tax=unclassified Salinivibrio TaxID=2636825 RepID=UPI0009886BEA|nr:MULTISPECIES: response regulator transcription factor [unclassified Salinivibrio]OOE72260.1 two-component system response regulator [Salinivibrio sp. ML290]OOF13965.1 two-component system response regulator [Salinivibrio sp. PR932]